MPTARTRLPLAGSIMTTDYRMPNLLLGAALCAAVAFFAIPVDLRAQQVNPAALPTHDSHQGLLIAVSPDVNAERSKTKFGKHTPYDAGILGLDVYFRNDNDMPIHINLENVRLFIGEPGGDRQKLEWLSDQEVADVILLKPPKDPTVRRPSPLPRLGGRSSGRGKDWDQLDGLLRSLAMSSDVLAPHSTAHGYFYFDIDHQFAWLSNARLDIPDLAFMPGDKALFFFQIDLAPAALR